MKWPIRFTLRIRLLSFYMRGTFYSLHLHTPKKNRTEKRILFRHLKAPDTFTYISLWPWIDNVTTNIFTSQCTAKQHDVVVVSQVIRHKTRKNENKSMLDNEFENNENEWRLHFKIPTLNIRCIWNGMSDVGKNWRRTNSFRKYIISKLNGSKLLDIEMHLVLRLNGTK